MKGDSDFAARARQAARKALSRNGTARKVADDPAPEAREYDGDPEPALDDVTASPSPELGDAWEPTSAPAPPRPLPPRGGYTFAPMNSAAFAALDCEPEWLIKNLLVARQPSILAGPKKVLKTSAVIDLAVSLASGSPFLGEFTVYRPVRVCVISGESGQFTVQETVRRICDVKGLDLADLGIFWEFRLPQLANPDHLDVLGDGLRRLAIDVLILDPLYLSLLSGPAAQRLQASNVFDMGPLLLGIAEVCLSAGTTPLLIHHTHKNAGSDFEPLDLGDLAFSGTGEFARQWLMLNRREKYAPGSGLHRLWLASGGSVGHGGCWAVDVDEGVHQRGLYGPPLGGHGPPGGRRAVGGEGRAGRGAEGEAAAAGQRRRRQRAPGAGRAGGDRRGGLQPNQDARPPEQRPHGARRPPPRGQRGH